jgi:hypothetical protein
MNVQTLCIEPDSPWLNRYAESFHSCLRDELLNVEEFGNVGMPASMQGLGVRITTSAGLLVRWAVYRPKSSRLAVLRPCGARPPSSSTANQFPFTDPNS